MTSKFIKRTLFKAVVMPILMIVVVCLFPNISMTGIILTAILLLTSVTAIGYRFI